MVDDKRFRIFFVINPLYHSRNIANSISSQPFWYNSSDFRTLVPSDATEFVDAAGHQLMYIIASTICRKYDVLSHQNQYAKTPRKW